MIHGRCFICDDYAFLDKHECLHGAKYRKLSIKYGLQLKLCRTCHTRLHAMPELNDKYKVLMQVKFEREHGHEEWMNVFGRNYKGGVNE